MEQSLQADFSLAHAEGNTMQDLFPMYNTGFDLPVPSNGSGNSWTSSGIGTGGGWAADWGGRGAAFNLRNDDLPKAVPAIEQTMTGWDAGIALYMQVEFSSGYAVPEPGTVSLLALGALCIPVMRSLRKQPEKRA